MKTTHLMFVFSLVALTGCSTTHPAGDTKADPETVLVTYHARPGREEELEELLARSWQIYQAEHLVFGRPHIVVRSTEDGGSTSFVEVLTWVSHATPEHVPDAVKKIWGQEQALCEARGGHGGIEGGEVELVTGK